MSLQGGKPFAFEFATVGPSGLQEAPDTTPVVTLITEGVAGTTFTVTAGASAGFWKAAITIPSNTPLGASLQARISSVAFGGDPSGPSYSNLGPCVGLIFERLARSYGAFREVQVVNGSLATKGLITIQPLAGEPALPTTGMVRTKPCRIAAEHDSCRACDNSFIKGSARSIHDCVER